MGYIGTGQDGQTLIGSGAGVSARFRSIGTASGLTNHGVVLAQDTNGFVATTAGTNGQVLIGGTGVDPAFSTITSSDGSIAFSVGVNT